MRRIFSVLLMFVALSASAQSTSQQSPNLRGDEEIVRFIEDNFIYPDGEAKKVQTLTVEFSLASDGHVALSRIVRPKSASTQMLRSMKHAFLQIGSWTPSDGVLPKGNVHDVYSIDVRIDPTYHWTGQMTTISKLQAGTLEQRLTPEQFTSLTQLKIEGQVNAADIRTIRRLAGTYTESGTKGHLEYLDLSQAQIINDKAPYLELDAAQEHLQARIITAGTTSAADKYFWEGATGFSIRYFLNDSVQQGKVVERAILDSEKKKWVDFTQKDLGPTWDNIILSGLKKVKGHAVKKNQQTGRYIYYSYPCKNTISPDMFYACPSLKAVILPWKYTLDEQVSIDFFNIQLLQ